MEHDAALPPPDFPIAADGLRRAAEQLERCANLPAVDSGVHTMQMMQALLQRFDRLEQSMRRGFADLGERMDALDRKVTISNKNLTARMRNSVVDHSAVELSPLCNATTGEPIAGFPRKLSDLGLYTMRQVDALLRELGEPVQGSADDRKRWLKYAIGVTT
ncbi:hypothetical protein GQ602_005262 [Ophiocordyceps camponoti-floridani]|uniref:Uncharacterized protein n=1 Tax=Ophiocordyceps camponoti-floridani TaxID=2030778 RepID=A0A8H4Q5E3_9HYPO|nr:hypothetical protein GQ602_005262 [Ophiocordyceps camponoti-floridani]